jgi:hypothetical protein
MVLSREAETPDCPYCPINRASIEMKDAADRIIYIGKAKNLKKR